MLKVSTGDLRVAASSAWGGSVAMSLIVCFVSFAVFWMGSRNTRDGD